MLGFPFLETEAISLGFKSGHLALKGASSSVLQIVDFAELLARVKNEIKRVNFGSGDCLD
jgi:hypothetical protein